MSPQRIQCKRTKRLPPDAVYVGRPTRWGNPWRVGDPHPLFGWPMNAGETVEFYRAAIEPHRLLMLAMDGGIPRGRDLACWCPLVDEHGNRVPCHADVLIELANR